MLMGIEMRERPKALQERIFTRLFEQAEIAKFNPKERREYEESIKEYWDYYSTMNTAIKKGHAEGLEEGLEKGRAEGLKEGLEKGRAEGLEKGLEKGRAEGLEKGLEKGRAEGKLEGILETARKMKQKGMPDDLISEMTGLSADEIQNVAACP